MKLKTTLGLLLLLATQASMGASTGQYPWDAPLHNLANDISGPVALGLGIIAVAVCGLVMALGDLQGGAKKALNVVFGLSIAFAASSLITTLFHSSGALIG